MPAMPRPEGDVRIAKTTYKGADRFEVTWRDPTNARRKLWYHNWRHALAAAKWANAQLEAAKGKTGYTFNDPRTAGSNSRSSAPKPKIPSQRKHLLLQAKSAGSGPPEIRFHAVGRHQNPTDR